MLPRWLSSLLLLFREAWSARRNVHIRFLKLQVEILQSRLPGNRIIPDPLERRRLLKIGAEMGHAVEHTLDIIHIKTYRRWLQEEKTGRWGRKVGRPRLTRSLRELITRLAKENLGWGARRILGELKKLAVRVSRSSVRRVLVDEKILPDPDRHAPKGVQTPWRKFIRIHMNVMVATDFFCKTIWTPLGKRTAYVLALPNSSLIKHKFVAVYGDFGVQSRSGHSAPRNVYFAYSDDGINWVPDSKNPVIIGDRDQFHSLIYDDQRRCFLLYLRPATRAGVAPDDPSIRGRNTRRRFAVTLSEDLHQWSYPRTVLVPDELDVPDIDQFLVVRYGSHFIGFAMRMNIAAMGTIETYLLSSRDGTQWHKLPDSKPFIPVGEPGSWDAGRIYGPCQLVRCGDWLNLYYSGTATGQLSYLSIMSSIGLAKIRPGCFVAQQGDDKGGYLLTKEILLEGNRLFLNCKPYRQEPPEETRRGEIRVELLERPNAPSVHVAASPIPGFSLQDCDPVHLPVERAPVSWKGKTDIGQLKGKAIYMRFFLRNALLYSFLIENQ